MKRKIPKSRNHIARASRMVNKPKVFKSRKGKGSYNRKSLKEPMAPFSLAA